MKEHDGETYRRLCEPFPNVEAANAAAKAFMDELYELRVKHRIRDVLIAVEVTITYEDGEGCPIMYGYYGDTDNAEKVAAYTFGRLQGDRQERVMLAQDDGLRRAMKKGTQRR